MANSKLRLVPVTGKYCQVNVLDKKFEIWRQQNGSKEKGTAVDYSDAVLLLSLQPPVVSLVPLIENGKFVSQLKSSDLEAIKEAQTTGQFRISNVFNGSYSESEVENKSSKTDQDLIKAQKEEIEVLHQTIAAQKEQNNMFQEQLKNLTAQVQAIQKTAK